MKAAAKKRSVSSCIPCYTKKQKCDRQYPCNHCSKRRRTDRCVYQQYPDRHVSSQSQGGEQALHPGGGFQLKESTHSNVTTANNATPSTSTSLVGQDLLPLTARYGYVESSRTNTLALIRKFGGDEYTLQDKSSEPLPAEDVNEVQESITNMPRRHILDFLLQLFVTEIAWIDLLIYPPWFLGQYRHWWTRQGALCVADVGFIVLVLRVCSYACQFLPSPYCTLDRVNGTLLTDIDSACQETADRLSSIVRRLDGRGSWIRVLHGVYHALKCQNTGDMNSCWNALACAVNVAQNDGMLHNELPRGRRVNELQKEMRRRTYCYLYTWDSELSKSFDRVPLLPMASPDRQWTQMRLFYLQEDETNNADRGAEAEGRSAPDYYTGRILQAKLATFWRRCDVERTGEYDMILAENHYGQFCEQFLVSLPSYFALHPDLAWDKQRARLSPLRQMLHISIFDSICWNFRPLLFQESEDIENMPGYKRVLRSSQMMALAVAALRVLEAVNTLHNMLGGSHTRLSRIIVPTFEATSILVCVCLQAEFLDEDNRAMELGTYARLDPLRTGEIVVTHSSCIRAIQEALRRLRMLAVVSNVAEAGAVALGPLAARILSERDDGVVMSGRDRNTRAFSGQVLIRTNQTQTGDRSVSERSPVAAGLRIQSQALFNDWETLMDDYTV